jgi:hypothetical protein
MHARRLCCFVQYTARRLHAGRLGRKIVRRSCKGQLTLCIAQVGELTFEDTLRAKRIVIVARGFHFLSTFCHRDFLTITRSLLETCPHEYSMLHNDNAVGV